MELESELKLLLKDEIEIKRLFSKDLKLSLPYEALQKPLQILEMMVSNHSIHPDLLQLKSTVGSKSTR